MALSREPADPYRPGRPMWVYIAGALLLFVLLTAVIFAVTYRSENYVDPEEAAAPIVTPPSAPTDGEASDSSGGVVPANSPRPNS